MSDFPTKTIEVTRGGHVCELVHEYDICNDLMVITATHKRNENSWVTARENYDENATPEIIDLFLTIVLQRVDQNLEQYV